MAIVQISKLQQRSGNLVDLPQLDEAELGFASDEKLLFIGKDSPAENIEVLTSYSNISFSQIEGSIGNLDIDPLTIANGQVLAYTGTEWTNKGGDAGGLITLGDVSNVKITGGAIGYTLETDGTGNLSWTPKGVISSFVQNATNANPAVITTTEDNFFTNAVAVTFTNLPGASGSVGNSLNGLTLYANIISSNSFSLYTDSALTTTYDASGDTVFPFTAATAANSVNDQVTVSNATAFTVNDAVVFIGNTDQSNSNIVAGTTYYVSAKDTAAPNTWIAISETVGGSNLQLGNASFTANVYASGGRITSPIGTSGGVGSPGGTTNTIQYNNAGTFAGDSDLTFNPTTNLLTVNGNVDVANNVTAARLISDIATGTEPITVTSTTRVANLNVTYANVSDFGNVTLQTTGTFFPIFVNGSATANRALAANANLTFNAATGNLTATILNATSNVSGGNLTSSGVVSATGNVSGGNITTTGVVSATGNVSGGNITTTGVVAATGNVSGGNITTTGVVSATGNVSGGNITTTGVVSATGNVSGGNITTTGLLTVANITTGSSGTQGNITGNWILTSGSRLQATYADLAEYYAGDQYYEPGTVLEFGGSAEVTLASDGSNKVAGVVSTDPAYAMNAKCPGIATAIALQGRVPCKVRGNIKKGDMMISGGNGYARPCSAPQVGTVIGKSLVDFSGTEGVIEIAVGRV